MNVSKYSIKPQSGLISITTGETRGMKAMETSAPWGAEYQLSSAPVGADGHAGLYATGFTRGY